MKNLITLLFLILVTSVMQGQTIPKEEVTGTWQVIGVVEEGTYPGQGEEMIGSFFDLYPDHNFQLRMKRNDRPSKGFDEIFRNTTWNYDETKQTITLKDGRFPLKVSRESNKTFFELVGIGLILQVHKPM